MLAVAYVRVSSRGQNFELQRGAIERAAILRGDAVRFVEEKRSGALLSRPALDALREEVRRGEVKRLYVYRLDRLTRSGIRDTFQLIDELRAHGCELVTCSDGFDLTGPLAEPLLALMAWAAKMENHVRRERQAAARDRIETEGGRWGRPRRMTAAQLDQAKQLQAAGAPVRDIARAVKVPRSTVSRRLSQKYTFGTPPTKRAGSV